MDNTLFGAPHYTTAVTQSEKLALSTRVNEKRLAGYNDQEIAELLNIDPHSVSGWADYHARNAALRKPLMTAEAVAEELTRVELWLSRLSKVFDDLGESQRPSEIHKCIVSFERLSKQRVSLLTMQTAVRSADPNSDGSGITDEAMEKEYQALLKKMQTAVEDKAENAVHQPFGRSTDATSASESNEVASASESKEQS